MTPSRRLVADDVVSDPGVSGQERFDVFDLGPVRLLRPEDVELFALEQLAKQFPTVFPLVVFIARVVVLDVVGGDADRGEPLFAGRRLGLRIAVFRTAQREERYAEQKQAEECFLCHCSEV